MLLRWEGNRAVADREMIAEIYEVSDRTVRRHCTPLRYERRAGEPRGAGRALYDVTGCADQLAGVAPRPARLAALATYRMPRTERRAA